MTPTSWNSGGVRLAFTWQNIWEQRRGRNWPMAPNGGAPVIPGDRLLSELKPLSAPAPVPDAAAFRSILFPYGESSADIDSRREPECFSDLNLDQVVEQVTAGSENYNLQPFFHSPTRSVPLIRYRHDVFRDLEMSEPQNGLREFAAAMRRVRGHLAQAEKMYYRLQKQRCFLDAVDVYRGAVRRLAAALASAHVRSEGLMRFRRFLDGYLSQQKFRTLESGAQNLLDGLAQVRYVLLIDGKRVIVRRGATEPDYGADVLETFEKFRQSAPRERHFNFRFTAEMNHVEAAILDRVSRLFPDVFSALAEFSSDYENFQEPVIVRFDREIQFYLTWIDYMHRFRNAELAFCYPAVSDQSKQVSAQDGFDLALAARPGPDRSPIVTNSFSLTGDERVMVITGPNQGGKTTFARMVGQLHYLAGLGCPVPARDASLFLCDRLFTHFEREESVETLTGKLEDELLRIHSIFEQATPNSLLIMNESFLSTTPNDALFLSRRIMERVLQLGMLCVSVTFLDELASVSAEMVSMVGGVDAADPTRRTFRILRRPADGMAYAMAIARKYRLTQDAVMDRIGRASGERRL